jgi:quercetin dioxygenase-like cupin family protein
MYYTVRTAAESESTTIEEPWGSLRWLASTAIGNAEGVTVGHVTIKAGQANPRHHHTTCEEVLYLLRGRLRHSMGEETVVLKAGDTLTVAAHVAHHAVNVGEEDAEMIVAYSSGVRDFVSEDE